MVFFFAIYSCINKAKNSNIIYDRYICDLGKLRFKIKAEGEFKIKNMGEGSLSIKFVKTNCGCISSKWSENEIKPNETGKIIIQKDTGIPGAFEDKILVYYNEVDLPDTLIIKGEVVYNMQKSN